MRLPPIVYSAALLPTALSAGAAPQPLVSAKLDIAMLWRNSPVAVFAVLMVGISNAAFGTLSAVYAARSGLDVTGVALFASLPILAGALAQIPVGWMSDRFDRRLVLLAIALIALSADALFVFSGPSSELALLGTSAIFGATVFSMYPVIVAHASDHAEPGTFIQISGGLLLVFGIGSMVGPTLAGFAMSGLGNYSLFAITGSAHILTAAFTAYRMSMRAAVSDDQKGTFQASPMGRATTPETVNLSSDETPDPDGLDTADESQTMSLGDDRDVD